MSIFYNIRQFRHENFLHALTLTVLFLATFCASGAALIFGINSDQAPLFWQTAQSAPIIFGTLTYVVLGISLSYFSQKIFTKIICFATVVTDVQNKRLVNSFLINLLALNVFASIMIIGYIALYFIQPSDLVSHLAVLAQNSLIIPVTYCMRILEGCIDKIVNLEHDVEKNCLRYINIQE